MRVMPIVGAAILLASASQVVADPPQTTAPALPVRDAIFLNIPRGYEALGPVGPYYPAEAARDRVDGVAVIRCALAASGRLNNCAIVDEKPGRHDFGLAALVMARRGVVQAQPRSVDGQPVAIEEVLVRVPFQMRNPRS